MALGRRRILGGRRRITSGSQMDRRKSVKRKAFGPRPAEIPWFLADGAAMQLEFKNG